MPLLQRIETLRQRHASLDHLLWEEEHRPLPDFMKLRHLKREKLLLKDQMSIMAREDEGALEKRKRAS